MMSNALNRFNETSSQQIFFPSSDAMTSRFRYFMNTLQVNHPTEFMQKMDNLRKANILTDITLEVEDKEFKAHKAVLAAHSEYFCIMFTGDMVEKNKFTVQLKDLSSIGLEIILDYIYTSKLILTDENVELVLATANYLQMEYIVDICTQYLESVLCVENCIDILSLVESYQLTKFENLVLSFICNHFSHLTPRNSLFGLSPEQIISILKSDLPMDCGELDVLKIILDWFLKCDKSL